MNNENIVKAFHAKYPDFEYNPMFILDTIELLRESGYIKPNVFQLYETILKQYKDECSQFELEAAKKSLSAIIHHVLGYALKPDQTLELMRCLVTHTRLRKRRTWYQHEYFWYAAAIIAGVALAIMDIKVNGL